MLNSNQPKRLQDILRYIQENYAECITLKDVANIANCSPEECCRYLKKHTGTTFIKYLTKVRIEKACELLTNNIDELYVSTIAYEVGYQDISTFNRAFQRIKGMSPTEYVNSVNEAKTKEVDIQALQIRTFCNKKDCVCYEMSLKALSTCANAVPIRACAVQKNKI